MANELRDFVKFIQYKYDLTIAQIAEKIGYDRAYLNDQMNKGGGKKLLNVLKSHFKEGPSVPAPVRELPEVSEVAVTYPASVENRLISSLEENNRFLKETVLARLAALESTIAAQLASAEANLVKHLVGLASKSHVGIETILEELERMQGLPTKSLGKSADSKLAARVAADHRKGKKPVRGN